MAKRKWRKTKFSFSLLILLVVVFFCLFNTSTRWGRWLYWQGPSWKDVDRFAWRAVESDPENVKPFFANKLASGSTHAVSEPPITETWPTTEWQILASPEEAGWSAEKLAEAVAFSESIGSDAVLVVCDGKIVQQWGIVDQPFAVYSIRKSLLGSLIGLAIEANQIEINDTLSSLSINDINPALTAAEKSATVKDLLTSRSGVYHPAAYEAAVHRANRPARGAHQPGEFFYYNNWDFNALGSIYNQATNRDLFREFKERIADPLQMQDFTLDRTEYRFEPTSQHPAYLFQISARDLARFGLLYLRAGRWQSKQLIPAHWVAESTRTQVDHATENRSFGYLWWTYPQFGNYFGASGSGGQKLIVVPDKNIVIVHLASENQLGRGGVGNRDFWRLFQKILAAAPES